jgi:hypothetical protein
LGSGPHDHRRDIELSKQKTLALPINTLCPLILRDYQANEGWNWAELDARTQVARIEWAVSGLTSNTFATHCWKVRAGVGHHRAPKSRDTD